MASTLYIQMPPKSMADITPTWSEHAFPFCLLSGDKRPMQHGRQNFQDLKELAKSATQVVLLLASCDVSMFDIEVPPMPMQKLRAALPNLLEEQLLIDPAELLFVCGNPENGRCSVAVVSRAWMESLLAAAQILDAKKLAAYPLSMALKSAPDAQTAVIEHVIGTVDQFILSVKSSATFSAGLAISLEKNSNGSFRVEPSIASIGLFCSASQVELCVDSVVLAEVTDAVKRLESGSPEYRVQALDWTHKIGSDLPPMLNLFSLLSQENQASFDWQKWRWSVVLATAIIVISISALNWEWYRLKSEANALNTSLLTTYKNLFPDERSMRDPLLQIQQKINLSKKLAGQSTEEDFLVMSGQFSQAWQLAHPQGIQLAGLEYKERSLFAKAKNSSEVQVESLRAALKEYGLKLELKEGNYKISRDEGSNK